MNTAEFSEFIHEQIHAGACRSNHFRERILINSGNDRRFHTSRIVIDQYILSDLSQLPDETIGIADRWVLKDEVLNFCSARLVHFINPVHDQNPA